jgi:putative ABC transport system permease protein
MQVAVALALFGILQGMKVGVDKVVANLPQDLLIVSPFFGLASPPPSSDADRIRSIAGVRAVTFVNFLSGTYQRPSQQVSVVGLEKSNLWQSLLPFFVTIAPKDLHALQNTRTGVLITPNAAKKYGWRVGDRIPIRSSTLQNNGSGTWVFDIVGIANPGLKETSNIYANYDYLDAARALNKGTVLQFFVVVADPKQATAVSARIDRTFANSPNATSTQPLRVSMQQQARHIGDVNFLIRSIVSAVLVALMFSITTMMMQTVRERTPELAVLKTMGFSDMTVFLLVVFEALVLCIAGALIGLGLATSVLSLGGRFIIGLSMSGVVLALGLVGAVVISLISVSMPALRAAKLQVVDALAGR